MIKGPFVLSSGRLDGGAPDAIGPWLFGQSDRFGRRVGFEHNANTGVQNFGCPAEHPHALADKRFFVAPQSEKSGRLP